MKRLDRQGFTILELLFTILVGGLFALSLAHLMDTAGRVGEANRSGADARALEWTTERVLRRALEEAGAGMPSAPNLGGVGVRTATRTDGTPADTLVVLRGDGDALPVAARPCRAGVPDCIALVGDHRTRLAAGDVLVVGARGTGLAVFQVAEAPEVFYAPCAGDCPERLVCPVTPGPAQSFLRVVGSVRQPGGATSPGPCPHAFFPDGSRCEEVVQLVPAGVRQEPSCRADGPPSAFTEVHVVDRTVALGFPAPPASLTRGGAGGTPRVRAVKVRASRFWVRATAGDSVLVRQNGLLASGEWRAAVGVAGPVRGLRVETLHGGAWRAGAGVGAADLVPSAGNANYVWRGAPAASGLEPGAKFLRGHHTVSAVRVRYLYRAASAGHGLPAVHEAWMVVPTPALLEGGTGDVR
ncbi:MAG TPA: hypothetical protein VF746_24400 [Longimicrobium sp.]|jgi:hypothetical protein